MHLKYILGDNFFKYNFVDPQMFLQGALAISSDDNNEEQVGLKECLEHELSPQSMSLFNYHGFMRSNIKADLSSHMIKDSNCVITLFEIFNKNIVLEGVLLLHRIK